MTEKLSTEYEQRLLQVKQNYDYIMARIAEAAEKSGRKPEDIKFLAATKTVSYDIKLCYFPWTEIYRRK